jgi:hypothetical protein
MTINNNASERSLNQMQKCKWEKPTSFRLATHPTESLVLHAEKARSIASFINYLKSGKVEWKWRNIPPEEREEIGFRNGAARRVLH